MRTPTPRDISARYGCRDESLDEASARETFGGKSLVEAQCLFQQNALFYAGCLFWMGKHGFQFYLQAFIGYILSPSSLSDPDAISTFLDLVEEKHRKKGNITEDVAPSIATALDHIIINYPSFEIREEIYGDLRSKAEELKKSLKNTQK